MTDTDIVRRNTLIDDETLSSISSFDQALAVLSDILGSSGLEQVSDYGTGFLICKDNDGLVSVPFVIIQWAFNEGDFGLFVSAELVTKNGDKLVLNDGSTGIYRQLVGVTAAREKAGRPDTHAGLAVPRGLTRTDYFFNEDTGETSSVKPDGKAWKPAHTYYLAQ